MHVEYEHNNNSNDNNPVKQTITDSIHQLTHNLLKPPNIIIIHLLPSITSHSSPGTNILIAPIATNSCTDLAPCTISHPNQWPTKGACFNQHIPSHHIIAQCDQRPYAFLSSQDTARIHSGPSFWTKFREYNVCNAFYSHPSWWTKCSCLPTCWVSQGQPGREGHDSRPQLRIRQWIPSPDCSTLSQRATSRRPDMTSLEGGGGYARVSVHSYHK